MLTAPGTCPAPNSSGRRVSSTSVPLSESASTSCGVIARPRARTSAMVAAPWRFSVTSCGKYGGIADCPSIRARTNASSSPSSTGRKAGSRCFSRPIVETRSSDNARPQADPAPCAGQTSVASGSVSSFSFKV